MEYRLGPDPEIIRIMKEESYLLRVYDVVHESVAIKMSDLARKVGMQVNDVGKYVKELEEEGLVEVELIPSSNEAERIVKLKKDVLNNKAFKETVKIIEKAP
jgi:DNA-binding MarR family transcriptional regulator